MVWWNMNLLNGIHLYHFTTIWIVSTSSYKGGMKMKGIYKYTDLETDEIVYVGKDKAKGLKWRKLE